MIRSDLIARIAQAHPAVPPNDVAHAIKTILDSMTEHLAHGERIEIRGFGSFDISHRPSRIARNPKTGEQLEVPGKPCVRFKAGKELRERANTVPKTIA